MTVRLTPAQRQLLLFMARHHYVRIPGGGRAREYNVRTPATFGEYRTLEALKRKGLVTHDRGSSFYYVISRKGLALVRRSRR